MKLTQISKTSNFKIATYFFPHHLAFLLSPDILNHQTRGAEDDKTEEC